MLSEIEYEELSHREIDMYYSNNPHKAFEEINEPFTMVKNKLKEGNVSAIH